MFGTIGPVAIFLVVLAAGMGALVNWRRSRSV